MIRAAETAFARQQHVSTIDVLCGMGLLQPVHVDSWRKGRIDFLEQVIQGNPDKISQSITFFHRWAQGKGLNPSETEYLLHTRSGATSLRFSENVNPATEQRYRTHYLSPTLKESKQQRLRKKQSEAPKPVAFVVLRSASCSECGVDLDAGSFLSMEGELTLCLACAGLGDLEFLSAGDAALTRRATKYSTRSAVVVRFNRARKRNERQGILVEVAAIEKAERECVEDADERAAARAQGAIRRAKEDRELALSMASEIETLFPACPPDEATAIAEHTAIRGSGRVGRTASGRNLEPQALTAAVIASIRHRHTNYDALLAGGVDRAEARQQIAREIDEILATWRLRK